MHPVRRTILLVACATALSIPATSFAQSVEIARKLLEEAKKLKDANKIAEACPLLDRAYEMDAKDGILFARADCRDQEEDPRRCIAAPCSGEDRCRCRYPAHQVGQDHRTRGARRGAWPAGQEQGGAGKS